MEDKKKSRKGFWIQYILSLLPFFLFVPFYVMGIQINFWFYGCFIYLIIWPVFWTIYKKYNDNVKNIHIATGTIFGVILQFVIALSIVWWAFRDQYKYRNLNGTLTEKGIRYIDSLNRESTFDSLKTTKDSLFLLLNSRKNIKFNLDNVVNVMIVNFLGNDKIEIIIDDRDYKSSVPNKYCYSNPELFNNSILMEKIVKDLRSKIEMKKRKEKSFIEDET